MKLLFDENLSYKLCERVKDIFPGSTHTKLEGLSSASDQEIWQFAKKNQYSIVTKDSDFNDMLVLNGFPPHIIWIRSGNSRISAIELLLRSHKNSINSLIAEQKQGLIELTT